MGMRGGLDALNIRYPLLLSKVNKPDLLTITLE